VKSEIDEASIAAQPCFSLPWWTIVRGTESTVGILHSPVRLLNNGYMWTYLRGVAEGGVCVSALRCGALRLTERNLSVVNVEVGGQGKGR